MLRVLAFIALMGAAAMSTDAPSVLALIRATPTLQVDRTIVSPGGFDPKTQPYVKFKHDEQQVGGFVSTDYASIGMMDGGTRVMAVPLDSGGSGTVFTQLIYAQGPDDAKPFFAGAISSGGHLGVNIEYHGIVARSPDNSFADPNCCPSHYIIETYVISGHALKRVSRVIVRSGLQPDSPPPHR